MFAFLLFITYGYMDDSLLCKLSISVFRVHMLFVQILRQPHSQEIIKHN